MSTAHKWGIGITVAVLAVAVAVCVYAKKRKEKKDDFFGKVDKLISGGPGADTPPAGPANPGPKKPGLQPGK